MLLWECSNDILLLVNVFLLEFCKKNKFGVLSLDKGVKSKLLGYFFFGNVRELWVIIELVVVMVEGGKIMEDDI